MIVTALSPEDHPDVALVLHACSADVDLGAEQERPWARAWVARRVPSEPVIAILLAWAVADELHVQQVVTHPDHRRRGAAGALLDAAVRHASDTRARMVLLEVRRGNGGAIQLYRSRGFHVIGVRRGYYGRDGEDALEMVLNLNPQNGAVEPGQDVVVT